MRHDEHDEWMENHKARKAALNDRVSKKAAKSGPPSPPPKKEDDKKKDDGESETDRNWVLW